VDVVGAFVVVTTTGSVVISMSGFGIGSGFVVVSGDVVIVVVCVVVATLVVVILAVVVVCSSVVVVTGAYDDGLVCACVAFVVVGAVVASLCAVVVCAGLAVGSSVEVGVSDIVAADILLAVYAAGHTNIVTHKYIFVSRV